MYDQVLSIFLTMGDYFPSFQKTFYVLGLKMSMCMVKMTKVLVTRVLSKKRVLRDWSKSKEGRWAGAFGNVVDKKHMTDLLPSAQK